MMRILIVCVANICRSPMAQRVTEAMAATGPLGSRLRVESAGIHVGRPGAPPDPRALAALARRGYAERRVRSREMQPDDFDRCDLILAMDRGILAELMRLCPAEEQHKLRLFLDFSPSLSGTDVPDPYFGSAQGFENVLDLCETGARALLSEIDLRPAP